MLVYVHRLHRLDGYGLAAVVRLDFELAAVLFQNSAQAVIGMVDLRSGRIWVDLFSRREPKLDGG